MDIVVVATTATAIEALAGVRTVAYQRTLCPDSTRTFTFTKGLEDLKEEETVGEIHRTARKFLTMTAMLLQISEAKNPQLMTLCADKPYHFLLAMIQSSF